MRRTLWRFRCCEDRRDKLEMAVRHVAEREQRIARQEARIERLREVGVPLDRSLGLLGETRKTS